MHRPRHAQVRKARREQRTDHLKELAQGSLLAHRDVVDLVERRGLVGERGEEIGLHHVVDVAEVARRLAVAIDVGGLVAHHRRDPARDHRRVIAVRVLARPEHVEIAQADGFEAVALREHLRIELVHVLGEPVGRERPADHLFDLRQRRVIAVNGARARVHETRGARFARRDQHVEKPGDVGFAGGDRVIDRARHAAERRLVQHQLGAGAGLAAGVERADVALDQAEVAPARLAHRRGELRQVLAPAGREVVEPDHALIEREQAREKVRADEAGAAGQKPGLRAAAKPHAQHLVGPRANGHVTSA